MCGQVPWPPGLLAGGRSWNLKRNEKKYSGPGSKAYGVEYSEDSIEIARIVHGKEYVHQGDASLNFVDQSMKV